MNVNLGSHVALRHEGATMMTRTDAVAPTEGLPPRALLEAHIACAEEGVCRVSEPVSCPAIYAGLRLQRSDLRQRLRARGAGAALDHEVRAEHTLHDQPTDHAALRRAPPSSARASVARSSQAATCSSTPSVCGFRSSSTDRAHRRSRWTGHRSSTRSRPNLQRPVHPWHSVCVPSV